MSNWVMGDILRIVRERKLDERPGHPRLAGGRPSSWRPWSS